MASVVMAVAVAWRRSVRWRLRAWVAHSWAMVLWGGVWTLFRSSVAVLSEGTKVG